MRLHCKVFHLLEEVFFSSGFGSARSTMINLKLKNLYAKIDNFLYTLQSTPKYTQSCLFISISVTAFYVELS
jgi:hypothetical protein